MLSRTIVIVRRCMTADVVIIPSICSNLKCDGGIESPPSDIKPKFPSPWMVANNMRKGQNFIILTIITISAKMTARNDENLVLSIPPKPYPYYSNGTASYKTLIEKIIILVILSMNNEIMSCTFCVLFCTSSQQVVSAKVVSQNEAPRCSRCFCDSVRLPIFWLFFLSHHHLYSKWWLLRTNDGWVLLPRGSKGESYLHWIILYWVWKDFRWQMHTDG